MDRTIYVFESWGERLADINDGEETHRLNASVDQIHSALAGNGWVRVGKPSQDDGVCGVYVHSNNWPLDQKRDPLKEFYA